MSEQHWLDNGEQEQDTFIQTTSLQKLHEQRTTLMIKRNDGINFIIRFATRQQAADFSKTLTIPGFTPDIYATYAHLASGRTNILLGHTSQGLQHSLRMYSGHFVPTSGKNILLKESQVPTFLFRSESNIAFGPSDEENLLKLV